MKQRGFVRPTEGFKPIHMPRNTGAGLIIAGFSVGFGVGMIWYVWWLAAICFVGMLGAAIGHTFNYKRDYHIPVDEVIETEGRRTRQLAAGAVA